MSGHLSGQAPNNIGDGKPQNHLDQTQNEVDTSAIAMVKAALVKGGVRPDKVGTVAEIVMTQVESYHSGPLPTVSDFAGYEQICTGAARDILDMARNDQANSRELKRIEAYGTIWLSTLGILSALAVVGGMLFSAIYAAMNGHETLATTIASGAGLALVAGVFLRWKAPKEEVTSSPPSRSRKQKKK